jgi:hypothetical protein
MGSPMLREIGSRRAARSALASTALVALFLALVPSAHAHGADVDAKACVACQLASEGGAAPPAPAEIGLDRPAPVESAPEALAAPLSSWEPAFEHPARAPPASLF